LPGANGPILVVDDDDVILGFIEMALKDEGYEVLQAPNGAAALELTRSHQPGLILLDMKMPVMDGWAFAKAYFEEPRARAPIVVMTAAADAARRAEDIGAEAYLPKPFDLDDLLILVGRMTRPA
jgi:two-component system, chemotaxis family, chemotaxis protein CheY